MPKPKAPGKHNRYRQARANVDDATKRARAEVRAGWRLTDTGKDADGRPMERAGLSLGAVVTVDEISDDRTRARKARVSVRGHHHDPASSIAESIADALNPDRVAPPPVTLHVEHHDRTAALKPHQKERHAWRKFLGRRVTCSMCGRTAVPCNSSGIWSHHRPDDEWCVKPPWMNA